MGIINRTQDLSEQKEMLENSVLGQTTGVVYPIGIISRPQTLADAKCSTLGLSLAPTVTLGIQRVTGLAGVTLIPISTALVQVAFGTSGFQTFSLPAAGSTLLNLQKGDLLTITAGGSTAGASSAMIDVVVQNSQDIKTWY